MEIANVWVIHSGFFYCNYYLMISDSAILLIDL